MSTPNPVTNIYDLNVNPYTGGFIGSLGGTNNDGNPSDAGNTVIGISTTDGGFTAVPQDGVTTVTIDGSLVSYTVDSNGDATTLLTGTAQQTADAINQNNLTSTTGPLTDTLYYEVQNDGGPITVDSVTSTYGDVDVNISSDSNVNNGALTDSPGTSVSLAGIDVSKFLSDDGNTVAVNPNLSVNIIAFDFGQQALHGTFAVDTSVAHLAATLGKPTWILLPFRPEWRWGLKRKDSPWYPSARLFRQHAAGDWESVIGRVGAAVREWKTGSE